MTSLLTCSAPFLFIINKYLCFRIYAMLRTGLIGIDREKVASVESDISSVSLCQLTPHSGPRCWCLSGHLERHSRTSVTAEGKAVRMTWRGDTNKKQNTVTGNRKLAGYRPRHAVPRHVSGYFQLGWVAATAFSSPAHPQPIPSGHGV
jgi:hypothetical protein